MAIYSKKEFATACGQTTNWLSVYVKRKKVELTGENVDTTLKINADFLAKWSEKAGKTVDGPEIPALNAVKTTGRQPQKPLEEGELGPTSSDDSLTRAKKFEEIQMKRISRERAELDVQKKRGELIPVDHTKAIFGTYSRNIVTSFRDAADKLIILMATRYKIPDGDIAGLRKELTDSINRSNDGAIRNSETELMKVIEEFADSKEVGEHN